MKRIITCILSIVLIIGLCSCTAQKDILPPDFTDFTVYDYRNNKVSLSDVYGSGKPVIFNFWTTWCPYCINEMPDFEDVYKEYGDRVAFMMIDVNGGGNDTIPKAKDYIERMGYTFPVYFDSDLSAADAYRVSAFPTTGVIDAEGNLYYCQSGAMTKDKLISIIEDILK